MKTFALFAVLITLASCSHAQSADNVRRLEGQHIDTAIGYLGLPDDRYLLGEQNVYVWGQGIQDHDDNPITTYGGYGSNSGIFGGVGIVFGNTSHSRNNYSIYCSIKALTDQKHIIQKTEFKSTAGGCSEYSKGLKALEADSAL